MDCGCDSRCCLFTFFCQILNSKWDGKRISMKVQKCPWTGWGHGVNHKQRFIRRQNVVTSQIIVKVYTFVCQKLSPCEKGILRNSRQEKHQSRRLDRKKYIIRDDKKYFPFSPCLWVKDLRRDTIFQMYISDCLRWPVTLKTFYGRLKS